jgi:hypothetical protein
MAQGLQHAAHHEVVGPVEAETQLALYEGFDTGCLRPRVSARSGRSNGSRPDHQPLCAGCRAREARYGFRPEGMDVPAFDRPRTLCFDCFRVELSRRQLVRERMARGWNAHQVGLPLEDTLRALDKRRRRAQIAARHALDA